MNIDKFVNNHPSIQHAASINDLCRPLGLLGIKYFSHVQITNKEHFSAISSGPEFFELYFRKGYHHFDLHMANVTGAEKHIVWDLLNLKKQSSNMHQDFMNLNYGHTFSIVINQENIKNCYHFGVQLGDAQMNAKYLNLIDELKLFINYFTEQVAQDKTIKCAYSQKIQINKNVGGYFTDETGEDLSAFLQSVSGKRVYSLQGNNYLTQRELECLKWLAKGHTLEETGKILTISTRTVKAHVNAAKEKLKAKNQFQLGLNYSKLAFQKEN